MSEERFVESVQAALNAHGIQDTILVAGQFMPRGESGSMFAGGMVGADAGGAAGELASGIGLGLGAAAGRRANEAASGLPAHLLVGVSESAVYGAAEPRHHEPGEVLFAVPRAGLTATVHQRVNVRVLELINEESGSKIELEGGRIPVTHSKDVIHALTSG
jgi:hypothetical protein